MSGARSALLAAAILLGVPVLLLAFALLTVGFLGAGLGYGAASLLSVGLIAAALVATLVYALRGTR